MTPPERFVRTDADLFNLWVELMGPGGFSQRSLWLVFLDEENRMLPVVLPVDDLPVEPDTRMIGNLTTIIESLEAQHVRSVVMLLTRPGDGAMTSGDRRWARALHEELGGKYSHWPVHLAAAGRIQTFAPDDLIAAS